MAQLDFIQEAEAYLESIFRRVVRAELQELGHNRLQGPSNRIGGLELAEEVTGFKRQTIANKVSRGEMPSYKQGGKRYFSEIALREWMTGNYLPTKEETVANAHQLVESPRRKGGKKR